jgi:hypothetical protein
MNGKLIDVQHPKSNGRYLNGLATFYRTTTLIMETPNTMTRTTCRMQTICLEATQMAFMMILLMTESLRAWSLLGLQLLSYSSFITASNINLHIDEEKQLQESQLETIRPQTVKRNKNKMLEGYSLNLEIRN